MDTPLISAFMLQWDKYGECVLCNIMFGVINGAPSESLLDHPYISELNPLPSNINSSDMLKMLWLDPDH